MPRRRKKKKAEFEMLIISFCDIITISTAALLLALFVTVQLAVKIPTFRPTTRSTPSSKQPIFFECRNDQVFFIDKAGLDEQVEELMSKLTPGVRSGGIEGFRKSIEGQEVGNLYYKVDPRYLLVGKLVLEIRAGTSGEGAGDLENPNSKYLATLTLLDKDKQYIAFLVRDDSFAVFRKARQVADRLGLDTGWELLGIDEPIKFGAGGTTIGTQ
jgi:hypothetical protein